MTYLLARGNIIGLFEDLMAGDPVAIMITIGVAVIFAISGYFKYRASNKIRE